MPRGPKGEKRPADVIGAAVMVGRIATGEIEEGAGAPPDDGKDPAAVALGRKGGKARAEGMCDVSINTVSKILVDAGKVCAAYHDQYVRGLTCKRVQCDEIWSFCYSKQRNVKGAKKAPEGAGNVWTWTALDADTKLICTWSVGARDADSAANIMEDLRDRVKTRMQLTTDGLRVYLEAVQEAFGVDGIDYAQPVKI